ncbi:hypothetical protein Tco_1235473 [Tanacetum coccineum]
MIGVLTYFLKFQIKKFERGISINKEKEVNDLLRMYDKVSSSVNTPIMPPNMLGPNLNGKAVNESQYRDMIGPLMNLTASRPNIQLSTALCKTSSKHKESHLISVENFQQSVVMFSTEAEDIVAAGCYAIILWIESPQHILDQKVLNMRQHRSIELLSDYDCEIRYHPGKANVVADALSQKERIEPLRVRDLVMTIGLDLPLRILEAQKEVVKVENIEA